MEKKKIAGLVLAAGMSSRMRAFKPLLKLGEKTIIEHVVDTLRAGGVDEVVIITGNRGEAIKKQLEDREVHCIDNEEYSTTSMLHSIKLGVSYLENRCDEFFLLPGDIPLFTAYTISLMIKTMEENKGSLLQPMYKGKHGHPVLFSSKLIPDLLYYDGENGLKGAIGRISQSRLEIELPDKGILMDADTPEDYMQLQKYFNSMRTPSKELCMEILKHFKTDPWTIEHCIAVSEVAEEFALKLKEAGYPIDIGLVKAGALLHDVARREKDHAICGGMWLRKMGYFEVAEVIETHMNLPEEAIDLLDERAIVYVADKLVIGSEKVTIKERFNKAYIRFGDNRMAMKALNTRMYNAKLVLENIEKGIGGSTYENSFCS